MLTTPPSCDTGKPGKKKSKRICLADLLKVTCGIDVLPSSRCKIRTNLVGVLRDPRTIQGTFRAMNLSPTPPPVAPAKPTRLWKDALEVDDGIGIEAASGFGSESEGTSTIQITRIGGNFYPDF